MNGPGRLLARLALALPVTLPAVATALDVPLTVSARESVARPGTVVTSGVPFARAALASPGLVRVLQGTTELPIQVRRTASWPDGSVRWLLVDVPVDLPASPGSVGLTLRTGSAPAVAGGVTVSDAPSTLTVQTGAAAHVFDKADLLIGGARFEVVTGGTTYRARPESWTVEEPGPVKAVVRVEGRWATAAGAFLGGTDVRFRVRLTFWRNDAAVRLAATFQNRGTFCWDPFSGCTRAPDVTLSAATLGAALLPAGGSYVLGTGAERTWDVLVPPGAAPALVETRYQADGTLAPGSVPPPPIAATPPSYVVSTKAWGPMALAPSGLPADRQEAVDLFEKLHRALVLPADVEDPPGLTGSTVWGHLARDLSSWNDYGDLRWGGNGCGSLSGNHYDWSYGMALHFLRTGHLGFLDAARLLARHEEDLDVYHTAGDGPAFSFQKNWEDRPSHDSPDNCFGGGRPTHTWTQGYALHYLLTGDPRGKDAFDELQEGVRLYLYESFNGEGHVTTSEIRTHGWLTDNLVARYRVEPDAVLATSSYGPKTIPQAIRDVLADVLDREAEAGGQGYVYDSVGDEPDPSLRAPLQHLYFLDPLLSAHEEVFEGRDAATAAQLLGLADRMVRWLASVTYGGDTGGDGLYRPRQLPYRMDVREPLEGQGQIVYGLMAANAAAGVSAKTADPALLDFAWAAFGDTIRYGLVTGGDAYVDPSLRSPASYASSVFVDTESKVHGWLNRYGQRLLAAATAAPPSCTGDDATLCLQRGRFRVRVTWTNYNDGATGPGHAVALPPTPGDSGTFWFFSPGNVELFLKVLDGSGVNGRFWVFYGALTDVGFSLTVEDTVTFAVKTYVNPPHVQASVADVAAFDASVPTPSALAASLPPPARLLAPASAGCASGTEALCLAGGRFEVRVAWRSYHDGSTGSGKAVPLTADSGTFWFFADSNVELAIKVLDGRSVNGKFWVLYGALSDVEYTITVTDTQTGATRTYHNPPHVLGSRSDVSAF